MIRTQPLPYCANSAEVFEKMAHLDGAIFLDSGYPHSQQGRYDILVAWPYDHLEQDFTPLPTVDGALSQLKHRLNQTHLTPPTDLPFAGGAVGFISYDFGRSLESIPQNTAHPAQAFPTLHMGLYDVGLVVDHQQRQCTAFYTDNSYAKLERLLQVLASDRPSFAPFVCHYAWQAHTSRAAYAESFQRVIEHIHAGDIYQANLAQCFSARVSGAPWLLYKRLRANNPGPFSAFMQHANWAILSTSPERLLQVNATGQAIAQPIKGTAPRVSDPIRDQAFQANLRQCEKNRAENLMIVDLIRNDLSRSCLPGSVHVDRFCELQSFASVHHLVSTVRGQLAPNQHSTDLLAHCFPGGSITGAPKIRAQQIIEQLEPVRRHIYCGSLGYIGYNGSMDMNIAIRTPLWLEDTLYCYGGGAIVADSQESLEYDESLQKIARLLAAVDPNAPALDRTC